MKDYIVKTTGGSVIFQAPADSTLEGRSLAQTRPSEVFQVPEGPFVVFGDTLATGQEPIEVYFRILTRAQFLLAQDVYRGVYGDQVKLAVQDDPYGLGDLAVACVDLKAERYVGEPGAEKVNVTMILARLA